MKIIVGLGNPGDKYTKIRHNLGFNVVDKLRDKMDLGNWKEEKKFKSEMVKRTDIILVKPQTYMNNSGMAISSLVSYFKVDPAEDLIIIHDELDLHLGKIKVRLGGAAAGHHGVESIIGALGTDQFIRVRLGIGNEKSHSGEHKRIAFSAEKFVLEPFMPNEKSKVKHLIKQALEALDLLLDKGLPVAQNQYN